jgi:hypothetical protein
MDKREPPFSCRWLSKGDAIAFDRRYRAALANGTLARAAFGLKALEAWRHRFPLQLIVAASDGSRTAELLLQVAGQAEPATLLEELGLDHAWLFAHDLSCAMLAGHEDWDSAEFFEKKLAD